MKVKTVRYAVEYLDIVNGREVEKVEFVTMTKGSSPQDVADVIARMNGQKDFPCKVTKLSFNGVTEYCGEYIGRMTGSEIRRQNMMFQWLKGGTNK